MYTLDDIDLEEHALEHLQIKFDHYLFSGMLDPDLGDVDVLGKFVAWCETEMKEAISVKRGTEGISYLDRRAAEKNT